METRKKILLVEDEPEYADMIKMRLEASDYEVVLATDGKDGVAKALAENPDLILMDVMMPGMDGFQALDKLRLESLTRNTPVVMLTAKGESKSIMRAQDMRVADYLIKPCTSDDLLSTVKRFA